MELSISLSGNRWLGRRRNSEEESITPSNALHPKVAYSGDGPPKCTRYAALVYHMSSISSAMILRICSHHFKAS